MQNTKINLLNYEERGIQKDSITNQFRMLVKHAKKKTLPQTLKPLQIETDDAWKKESLKRQIQGPITLQWLVDDFVKAAGAGDVEKVDKYLRGGIPINMKHSLLQYTALHASTSLQNDEITQHLLQAGADVTIEARGHETVMHSAARFGNITLAKELLKGNAEIKSRNLYGQTPADIADEVEDHVMHSLLQIPPSPPTTVTCTSKTSTSMLLEWPPAQPTPKASTIYQYRIKWRLCDGFGEYTDDSDENVYILRNLIPATKYEITIQVGNSIIGWSEESQLFILETDGEIPHAMVAPVITEVSDSFIKLRILLPQSNGAPLERISIQAQCTGSITSVTSSTFRSLLRPKDQRDYWEQLALMDVNLMKESSDAINGYKDFVAVGLTPGNVYYFRARALNRNGWSPDGEISDGICTNDCPKLVKKGSKNMSLVWAKPYSTEDVDKYEIQCRVSYSTQWEVIDSNIQTESYEVTGLIPATAYTFRIRPHYERKGWENSTMCAATPLWHTEPSPPEPPVEFKLISSTSYSFTMFWKMPRCNGYAVEAYGLEYRIQGEQNKETAWTIASETIAVDFSNLMIENLQRGQIYEVRIRAKNLLGFGEYLYVRDTMRTLDYLPPLPPKCSAKASFSLTIEWTEEDTEETCYYEIQMIKLEKYTQGQELPIVEESKWKTIRSDCKEKKIVASGLSPLTWYCFRVRAFKKNGCQGCNKAKEHHSVTAFSEVSEPIQTIRRL